MQPDDNICYCYGVSMRKLVNFAKRVRPEHPSRMTECLGAGTGCGWCIPFLTKIAQDPEGFTLDDLTPEAYAKKRKDYVDTEPKNTFGTADRHSKPGEARS
jgi:NAD(P)H-nitrite reductase large subunit